MSLDLDVAISKAAELIVDDKSFVRAVYQGAVEICRLSMNELIFAPFN